MIRHIYRLSKQVQAGSNTVAAKRKVNTLVTASHIGVTLAYTVSQFIIIFYKNLTQDNRMISAFYFFGGLADLFLSLMLWFILDSDKAVTVLVDGDRIYAVQDVIRQGHIGINEDCIEEELPEDIPVEYVSSRKSTVSKLMIDQFFTEVEGPDRDWYQYDNSDIFGEDDDRSELIVVL